MMQGHRVPGGLVLPRVESLPTDAVIRTMPPPATLILPLLQHRGTAAAPCVRVGDVVQAGQCIATPGGLISVALHAPAAGRIAAIEPRANLLGPATPSLVLETDADQTPWTPSEDHADPERLTPDGLRAVIGTAGIAGLGGAAFPTAVKLAAQVDSRLHTLIINGAECDPAIGCDDALMQVAASDILNGTIWLLRALNIERALVAIKADKPRARRHMDEALAAAGDDRVTLVDVPARYPMGGERQLVQFLGGREVPADGLPIDVGFLCQNVATAYAVCQAVSQGRPLMSRVVSICGDAVAEPGYVDVPLGSTLADVIAFCGGVRGDVDRLIVGGRMMGTAVASDLLPVTKGVNALEVLGAPAQPATQPRPCIRCGECASVCPASLQPQQLHWHAKQGHLDALLDHKLSACIACGCCDAVCPSHLPLTQQFQQAQHAVHVRDADRLAARQSRRRYEQRNSRLERLAAERAERRAERQSRATHAPQATRKQAIMDAVARARKARAERERDS